MEGCEESGTNILNMASEQRTELMESVNGIESVRLRQVPPVIAAGYKI